MPNLTEAELITELNEMKHPFLCFLSGDLGAGKTTLVRKYLRSLGYSGLVKSPSFAIAEQYDLYKILHVDLYRLDRVDAKALSELGVLEYFQVYSIFVEWPERLDLPNFASNLHVRIIVQSNGSRIYAT